METQKKTYIETENEKKKLLKKFKKTAKKVKKITKTDTYIEVLGIFFDNDMDILIETVCRRVKIKVRIYEDNGKYEFFMNIFKGDFRRENYTTFCREGQVEDLDPNLKQMFDMLEYGIEQA